MKTVAFVPIRLNSQRVSGKNLRLLGGEPLMCHILRTLTRVEGIDEVYVFCSDEHIVELLPEAVRFRKRRAEARSHRPRAEDTDPHSSNPAADAIASTVSSMFLPSQETVMSAYCS